MLVGALVLKQSTASRIMSSCEPLYDQSSHNLVNLVVRRVWESAVGSRNILWCYGMAGSAVVGRCVVQVNRDPFAGTLICLPSSYRLLICGGGQLDVSEDNSMCPSANVEWAI